METTEELDQKTRDLIGIAYEVITSKVVKDDLMADEALKTMESVKYELILTANTLGLRGRMASIYQCLLVDELLSPEFNFNWWELMAYCNVMHINVPLDVEQRKELSSLAIVIYNHHIRKLQRMRMKRYIAAVFFGDQKVRDEVRPEVFHIEDNDEGGKLLSEDEIRSKGVDYWFPQIGSLTIDSVRSCFNYDEALYIVMLIGALDPREAQKKDTPEYIKLRPSNDVEEEDVYRILVSLYSSAQYDVRAYLTLDGPVLPYLSEAAENFEPLNDIAILKVRTLSLIATQEGLEFLIKGQTKPNIVMMFEWAVSQLSPTFISHHGMHRERIQASVYENTVSGQHVDNYPDEELVYFGERDGVTEVVVYTLKELYDAFRRPKDKDDTTSTGYCYDPVTILQHPIDFLQWRQFPRRSVSRLLDQILPFKRHSDWARSLEEECRRILNSSEGQETQIKIQRSLIASLKKVEKSTISSILIAMFNSGVQLMQLDESIDIYDDEAIQTQVMEDPLHLPPDPFATGRVQQELKNCIIDIIDAIGLAEEDGNLFKRLLIIEHYYNINVTHFEDEMYEIGNFLEVLMKMAHFNMQSFLILGGRWLYISASYYAKEILGYPLSAVMASFEIESYGFNRMIGRQEEELDEEL